LNVVTRGADIRGSLDVSSSGPGPTKDEDDETDSEEAARRKVRMDAKMGSEEAARMVEAQKRGIEEARRKRKEEKRKAEEEAEHAVEGERLKREWEEMKSWTHYEIMEVEPTIEKEDLLKAYRRKSLKEHPDKHSTYHAAMYGKRFAKLKDSYEVLRNPMERMQYDQQLRIQQARRYAQEAARRGPINDPWQDVRVRAARGPMNDPWQNVSAGRWRKGDEPSTGGRSEAAAEQRKFEAAARREEEEIRRRTIFYQNRLDEEMRQNEARSRYRQAEEEARAGEGYSQVGGSSGSGVRREPQEPQEQRGQEGQRRAAGIKWGKTAQQREEESQARQKHQEESMAKLRQQQGELKHYIQLEREKRAKEAAAKKEQKD
jgi:curved DNA-binding protein CbpA